MDTTRWYAPTLSGLSEKLLRVFPDSRLPDLSHHVYTDEIIKRKYYRIEIGKGPSRKLIQKFKKMFTTET